MANLAPVPSRVQILDWGRGLRDKTAYIVDIWTRWLVELAATVNKTAQQIGSVSLTAQTATIAATAIPTPTLTTGRYRLSYYVRITTPGTVSSSVTVSFVWTNGGIACTKPFVALTGNTTATTQSGSEVVLADMGTTLTYAVTYASAGATPMAFALEVWAESVPSI